MKVNLGDGTYLGSIVHPFGCYSPVYTILDSEGGKLMKIKGGSCGDCCICEFIFGKNTEFILKMRDGTEIGKFHKRYAEVQETLQRRIFIVNPHEIEASGVDFPQELNINFKALIVATLFLINYMYFDQESSEPAVAEIEADYLFQESSIDLESAQQQKENIYMHM